ncbi:MAG: hypothetical protein IPL53_13285 [Ignavibacteria bacterium]|nr:hypothetical protein [Ignavibacteria bacterium]
METKITEKIKEKGNNNLKNKTNKMTNSIFKNKIRSLIVTIMIIAAGITGCSDDSSTTPTQANNLSFSSMSSADSVGDLQGALVLDTVKILIKEIKLNVANNNQDSSNFKTGPFVLFLNLSAPVNVISAGIIPDGLYDKIKFEVHKLNDNEAVPDPEFADSNGRYSVIVKGRYLGNNFIYKSTKSAHQILQFPDSVQVTSANLTNITLIVKPYIWFIENNAYLDPREPSNSNDTDNNIKDNVNNNFRAFKDDDKNGIQDN